MPPEFVLVRPNLPPAVAHVTQPLARAGNVANVEMVQNRKAQYILEQFRG